MARPTRWIELFHEFIRPLRIFSKEILTSDEGGVPLELWESQRRFLAEIATGLEDGVRFFLCLKSRQLGITTISLVIDVFWCAMYPGTRGALVTDTESNRDANRAIIEGYIKSFPKNYFGTSFSIIKANRSFIQFSNGSILTFLVAGTKKKGVSWAEGKGYSFAHLTEVSKYGDPDALASFMESLAQKNPDRLFIIESTANGYNHFRNQWNEAKRDTATQRAFFIGWWASDTNFIDKNDKRFAQYGLDRPSGEERERVRLVREHYGHVITPEQLAWIRWKESSDAQSSSILQQNQPWLETDAFIQSGYSFFQTRVLNMDIQHMDAVNQEHALAGTRSEFAYDAYRYELGNDFWAMKLERIRRQEDRDKIELRVWQEPIKEAKYVLGFDPAYGRNEHKDRSAISVWRCYADRMVQVAEFASNMVEVKQAAWVMAHLAGAYEDCICNVELTGPGRLVMLEFDHLRDQLKSEAYAKIVKDRNWDEALDCARWYLYQKQDSGNKGGQYNFETTWRTKQEIMHGMRGSYMTKELHIRSKPLIQEMFVVVQDGSEIGAPESTSESCKDDRVFACALATRAWFNWRRPGQVANNETYERITQEESGDTTSAARQMNDVVYRFFKRADEYAEMEPARGPAWKVNRGLI